MRHPNSHRGHAPHAFRPRLRLPARTARPLSLIGGLCYGAGLAAGILGAWLLPAWLLAALMAAAFVAWVVTRRPL